MKAKNNVIKAPSKSIWLFLLALLLVIYGAYAVRHIGTGLAKGCGRDAVLSTMFPVRQLHLVPQAEDLWHDTVLGLIGDGESDLSSLGWALAESLKQPIMNMIYHGDCQTIDNLSESLDSLGLSLNSQGSN